MNRVAAFALRRKNSILSMSEKMFCPPQPLRFWITPACAGKRRSDWIIRSIYWDHPRMCGEKYQPRGMQVSTTGSPPRMRGKAEKAGPRYRAPGITPAHAGKRPGWADSGCQRGDHPCVCGEKIFEHPVSLANQGSLPRVRGKALADYAVIPNIGITPACAGKSPCGLCRHTQYRDHPRVCGEKTLCSAVSILK